MLAYCQSRQSISGLHHRAASLGDRQIKDAAQKLAAVSKQLVSYESVPGADLLLFLTRKEFGCVEHQVKLGSLLDIHLAKGEKLGARVETTSTAEELLKRPKHASKSKNEKTKNETRNSQQGKLFE